MNGLVAGPIVSLRPYPHPYVAMLAICSDLDETPDRRVYWEIARYLNTSQHTTMGPGLGLEVGNTLYFDMPPDQFAYWNTDEAGREMLRTLIRSGHVDCFHSYGDLALTRAHAARALDELARHDCRIEVWIDHATARTNFGSDIMRGEGDLPGSPAYHADLTCGFGVEYVWRGRVTSVIGQDVPRRLGGIFAVAHPLASARTFAKELAKGVLARRGSVKYAMHGPNRVLRQVTLRDGRSAREFLRCNPHWAAVDKGETADGLADVLLKRVLRRLISRGGTCVLYTHLGKVKDRETPFGPATRRALSRLADAWREGQVLVTTTRRLLGQKRALGELAWSAGWIPDGGVRIDVSYHGPRADLDGLTFYAPEPDRVRLFVSGQEAVSLSRNPADRTGRPSVSLPWPRLVFPA